MLIGRLDFRSMTAAIVLGSLASLILLTVGGLARPQGQQNASQNNSLNRFLRNYVGDPNSGNNKATRYFAAFVDLRDDGMLEAIVYLMDGGWCGSGGCTTLVLAPQGSSFRVIKRLTITRLPIRVLNTKSDGWHDLAVRVQGGGTTSAYEAKLSFNGKTYPSVSSAERLTRDVAGKIVVPVNTQGKLLFEQ